MIRAVYQGPAAADPALAGPLANACAASWSTGAGTRCRS